MVAILAIANERRKTDQVSRSGGGVVAHNELRRKVWMIVDPPEGGNAASRAFSLSILSLIALNVAAVIVGSIPSVEAQYGSLLYGFEVFSVAVFTVEYLIRLWVSAERNGSSSATAARLKYVVSPMAIIDFLAILPFYLTLGGVDTRVVRVLRLFRVFRIAKVGRYYNALSLIRNVLAAKKEELLLSTFVMGLLLILASSFMYHFENAAQPEAFPSIPAAMWWAVAALTTVGYGDVYPITVVGKITGALMAILGIGMFALPTGILASGFVDEIEKTKGTDKQGPLVCPHCHKVIKGDDRTP